MADSEYLLSLIPMEHGYSEPFDNKKGSLLKTSFCRELTIGSLGYFNMHADKSYTLVIGRVNSSNPTYITSNLIKKLIRIYSRFSCDVPIENIMMVTKPPKMSASYANYPGFYFVVHSNDKYKVKPSRKSFYSFMLYILRNPEVLEYINKCHIRDIESLSSKFIDDLVRLVITSRSLTNLGIYERCYMGYYIYSFYMSPYNTEDSYRNNNGFATEGEHLLNYDISNRRLATLSFLDRYADTLPIQFTTYLSRRVTEITDYISALSSKLNTLNQPKKEN